MEYQPSEKSDLTEFCGVMAPVRNGRKLHHAQSGARAMCELDVLRPCLSSGPYDE